MVQDKRELILDLVKRWYDSEWQRSRDLDSKAGNLIGYVTIVTGLIIGLGTFSILDKLSSPQYYVPYFFGISALLSSIILSLLAVKVRSWKFSPPIENLESYLKDNNRTSESISLTASFYIIGAVSNNFKTNESKARIISWSWISLVVGISFLVIFAGVFAAIGGPRNTHLAKVLVTDAIKSLQKNDTMDAIIHLTLADEQIGAINGNQSSKLFIEDSIEALKNNDTKHALSSSILGLRLIPNP
jgi:hypothetical protein